MKNLLSVMLGFAMVLSATTFAAIVDKDGRVIVSGPCIMSYTDSLGRIVRVIRSNSLVIYVKT